MRRQCVNRSRSHGRHLPRPAFARASLGRIKPGGQLFSKQQERQLGPARPAAAEVRQRNSKVVNNSSFRIPPHELVRVASQKEPRESGFRSHHFVNDKSVVNAFALPGGPQHLRKQVA